MLSALSSGLVFPPLETALRQPNGLLAVGGDLSAARILEAYRQGIFPWFNQDDPILWWSPDPRMVLIPAEFKTSHSLKKILRLAQFEVSFNCAFTEVMEACAAPRNGQVGTWIHPEMIAAYTELHRLGYAHSVETWLDGELVGGLYGVSIGKIFFGESMFSRRSNASKIALARLCQQLDRWEFGLIDCQMVTPHLASLGAREMSRMEFQQHLLKLVNCASINLPWKFDLEFCA